MCEKFMIFHLKKLKFREKMDYRSKKIQNLHLSSDFDEIWYETSFLDCELKIRIKWKISTYGGPFPPPPPSPPP